MLISDLTTRVWLLGLGMRINYVYMSVCVDTDVPFILAGVNL